MNKGINDGGDLPSELLEVNFWFIPFYWNNIYNVISIKCRLRAYINMIKNNA